jgi:hypothetical protein
MKTIILTAGLALALAQGGLPAGQLTSSPRRPHGERQMLVEFQSRVGHYVDLHRQIEAAGPPIPLAGNWTEVTAAIDGLAARIRTARAGARQGDVFSPEIEAWFRHTLATCLEGTSTNAYLATLEEEDAKDFVLKPHVNGRWPEGAPLPSMSPHLLAVLPPLPDELQYRFMNHDLVLWDVHANIIVDFIREALAAEGESAPGGRP